MVDAYPLPERYQVVYRCGENEGIADTLRDCNGAQAGLHPHELLEAALASSMTITARLAAERLGVPDARTSVRVWLDRADGVATFHHVVDLDPRLTEQQQRYVRQRVADCPVRQTLGEVLQFSPEEPPAEEPTPAPVTGASAAITDSRNR